MFLRLCRNISNLCHAQIKRILVCHSELLKKSLAFIYQKNDLEFSLANMQFDSYSTDVLVLVSEFCSKGYHLLIGEPY